MQALFDTATIKNKVIQAKLHGFYYCVHVH